MTTPLSRSTPARASRNDRGDQHLDDLMARVADGDHHAFSELYDRIAPPLLGRIRRLLINPAQSEEVLQDVFLELWQSAHRFDHRKAGALTWALTTARQRAIDRIRSEQASHDRDHRMGMRDRQSVFDDVAESVELRIEGDRMHAALRNLPQPQRQAISLTYFDGYSQSEAARLLRIPPGTVKTRQRSALTSLRIALDVA